MSYIYIAEPGFVVGPTTGQLRYNGTFDRETTSFIGVLVTVSF